MSPQCSYFQNYSDLLTLLQCQRVTNVTIAVQVHINFKKKKNYYFFFLARKFRVKLSLNPRRTRKFRCRGKTEALAVSENLNLNPKCSPPGLNSIFTLTDKSNSHAEDIGAMWA